MTQVIVERSFEDPAELQALQDLEDRGAWCLEQHHVRFIRTWVSKDRRRMICVYEAPDTESVRIAQRQAGMPLERAWEAAPLTPPSRGTDPPAGERVVVERVFDDPIGGDTLPGLFDAARECFMRHDVTWLGGHIASDGRRMLCVFAAPDAESVRVANRQAGTPFVQAWTATRHGAPEPT